MVDSFISYFCCCCCCCFFFIVSGYVQCCEAARIWTLNQVSLWGLHQGILKWVYKDGNMVKWHYYYYIVIIITSILNNISVWTGHYQFSFHCKPKFKPSQRSFMKSQIPCNYLEALILIHIQCLYKDRLHNVYNFGHLLIILLGSNVTYHSVLPLFIFPPFLATVKYGIRLQLSVLCWWPEILWVTKPIQHCKLPQNEPASMQCVELWDLTPLQPRTLSFPHNSNSIHLKGTLPEVT